VLDILGAPKLIGAYSLVGGKKIPSESVFSRMREKKKAFFSRMLFSRISNAGKKI
jgi:hypothetical protein